MAYHYSCRNIRLDDQQVLSAEAADMHGQWRPSALPLNLFLGNINGRFEWGKQAFGSSARSIRLEGGGETLAAELHDGRGYLPASVRLSDVITNDNGVLRAQVPVLVNYPEEQSHVVVDKILEQLKANADLAVTMVNAEEDEARAFVIHPYNEAVNGPDNISSFPVIRVSNAETIQQLTAEMDALQNTVNKGPWTLPSAGPGQLQAFCEDATASELNADRARLTGPMDTGHGGFVMSGFQSFQPAISLSGSAGFKDFGDNGRPRVDLGGIYGSY